MIGVNFSCPHCGYICSAGTTGTGIDTVSQCPDCLGKVSLTVCVVKDGEQPQSTIWHRSSPMYNDPQAPRSEYRYGPDHKRPYTESA